MHSFHWKVKAKDGHEKTWVKFLRVRSRNHGPKAPITVAKTIEHPVTKDLPDGWKTPNGELYNVNEVLNTATVLAKGDNGKVKEAQVCTWVNEYGKGRVFGTTIGHHNSTMETKEYLDLLANGITWALDSKQSHSGLLYPSSKNLRSVDLTFRSNFSFTEEGFPVA